MWIWPVLVLIGLIILGYVGVLLVQSRASSSAPSGASAARGILDERFARGEIDEEEYRRRRAELW
ncbi:MAG: SHOCT domain-containing protein [Pseudonocardiaceae bacterium]